MLLFMKTNLGPDDDLEPKCSKVARRLVWTVATGQYLCLLGLCSCADLNFFLCEPPHLMKKCLSPAPAFSPKRSGGRGCILRGFFLGCLRSSGVYNHWGCPHGVAAVQAPSHLRCHSQRHCCVLWRDCEGTFFGGGKKAVSGRARHSSGV